jgi:N-methylhydantoinase A
MIAGRNYAGPAVVTEYSATSVIPPGARFVVDAAGNLVITLSRQKPG